MTSSPETSGQSGGSPSGAPGASSQEQTSAEGSAGTTAPAAGQKRRLQDDPRAQQALAKKGHAAAPTAASGASHVKAAHESSKQGKKEKKVRW
ncbi:hypothetical protein FJV46_05020 [Arthrobacter agilis]|uniref:hypothetical protein n=1 Tax=Arthrobacter agilis TaxID=37921 RepID=UPI000B351B4E|nr:hypothetical protein [Arthrobacter agilis]OUM42411.1 hypothetical protein B8W74_10050 [Arthrobacter agilis]PPB45752.1 hypothetical protein CI784_12050 [Arthrobacter agilis]TPV26266.1 hypothetical protein FJV46_05020 [Arthrobacter agilis]VDR30883.1 Uncharacterised protein [Arthrobacter agilis]